MVTEHDHRCGQSVEVGRRQVVSPRFHRLCLDVWKQCVLASTDYLLMCGNSGSSVPQIAFGCVEGVGPRGLSSLLQIIV